MHAFTNWLAIIVIFVLPLGLGVGLIFAAFRLRRKWTRIAAGIAGLIFTVAFVAAVATLAPYMWALHLESKWSPANPKTKAELESYLSLYSQRDIQPAQSQWGHGHVLQLGERMTQYLLFWSEPLDVVYSSNNCDCYHLHLLRVSNWNQHNGPDDSCLHRGALCIVQP